MGITAYAWIACLSCLCTDWIAFSQHCWQKAGPDVVEARGSTRDMNPENDPFRPVTYSIHACASVRMLAVASEASAFGVHATPRRFSYNSPLPGRHPFFTIIFLLQDSKPVRFCCNAERKHPEPGALPGR